MTGATIWAVFARGYGIALRIASDWAHPAGCVVAIAAMLVNAVWLPWRNHVASDLTALAASIAAISALSCALTAHRRWGSGE